MKTRLLASAFALLVSAAHAYDAQFFWPSGARSFALCLTTAQGAPALPSGGLADGAASWNAVAQASLADWAPSLVRTTLTSSLSSGSAGENNGSNEIQFSTSIYGEAFGDRVLAVTTYRYEGPSTPPARLIETDILINTRNLTWDSYRGSLRSAQDLRRVLTHELGHAIGLQHPDQATPTQSVAAIMNSVVSNTDAPTADDLAGARALYGQTLTTPVLSRQPSSVATTVGQYAALTFELNGGPPPAASLLQRYTWSFRPTGSSSFQEIFTYREPQYIMGAAQSYDAGTYRLSIFTPDTQITANSVAVTVAATTTSSATRLNNLSTRGIAGSGNRSLIVGFSLTGSGNRTILLRAIGPTLGTFGVAGALTDPVLDLRDASGNAITSVDNWGTQSSYNQRDIFAQVGAFSLPDGSLDSALVVSLAPGNYTAVVTPKSGTAEGIALVEAYDVDAGTNGSSRLSNLSTRGFVSTEGNILIAGFSVSGSAPRSFLIRGIGDSLTSFGVSATLDDPTLQLYDSNGRLLRLTDDWDDPAFLQSRLSTVFGQVGAFTPTDRQESALWVTLAPGNYTAHFAGFNASTGIGLLEIYEAPNP